MESLAGKRLLILGCGYVGSAVARRAHAEEMQVWALTRNEVKAAALRADGTEVIVADLADTDWHARLPGGVDFALNCVSSGGGSPAERRHAYVDGMRSVLAWAHCRPPGALVYTGSTSVYPQTGGTPVDEAALTGGSERAQILLEAESLLLGCEAPGGMRRVVLRLAGIYGPGRHQLLDSLRRGALELPGDGTVRFNLIHRDDIVAAVFAAFAQPVAGIFNVADGQPPTRAMLTGWLAEKLGRLPPRFSGGVTSRRAGEGAAPDRIVSSAKLRAQLGWRPLYADFRAGYEAILANG